MQFDFCDYDQDDCFTPCPMRNCKGHLDSPDDPEGDPTIQFLSCSECGWVDPQSYKPRDHQDV